MNGILFKFARDWKQIYGGDSNAAKAAGHELLCIRSVLQLDVPDIFTPLTTLVDYAGFRITAVSLLPIDSTTLGKADNHLYYYFLPPFFSPLKFMDPIMEEKQWCQRALKLLVSWKTLHAN